MKNIKLFVAMVLLITLTFTAFANDYALLDTYPLLDEMKSAKQQQTVLNNIKNTILEHKYNSQDQLTHLKAHFTTALTSLSKGTKVTIIKNKIEELKLQWKQDNYSLDAAINHKMYEEEAFKTIEKLSKTLNELNTLYTQSYARYKQKSIMKSLVSSYMQTKDASKAKYAFNTIN